VLITIVLCKEKLAQLINNKCSKKYWNIIHHTSYLLGIIQNTLENYVLATTTTTTITTTKYGYTYNKFTALLNKLLK
jgi:hypothetical protein